MWCHFISIVDGETLLCWLRECFKARYCFLLKIIKILKFSIHLCGWYSRLLTTFFILVRENCRIYFTCKLLSPTKLSLAILNSYFSAVDYYGYRKRIVVKRTWRYATESAIFITLSMMPIYSTRTVVVLNTFGFIAFWLKLNIIKTIDAILFILYWWN